jgi:flagellar export protein FliJ
MAFRFPLDGLLHYWRSLEHQQELRLRAANQQVAKMRHMIERTDAQLAATHSQQLQRLALGTTGAEVRFSLLGQAVWRDRRSSLERELARYEQIREQQHELFQKLRRQRETVESLRAHQLNEYERAARRRNQRQLDQMFLLRQAYLRRG